MLRNAISISQNIWCLHRIVNQSKDWIRLDETWIVEKEFAENREYGAAGFCCFCFVCSSNVLTFVNFLDGFLLRICGEIFEAAIPLVQFFPFLMATFSI